jgi:hypothetical protein
MSLDAVLAKSMASVPECVSAGYVDMSTGMLLAVKTVDSHPQEVLDLVAAATADLFQGQSVTAIEKMFRKSRGHSEDNKHYFNEILVFSDNLLHLFFRSKKHADQAAVFVCRKSVNVGMALTKGRTSMLEIEASV